MTLRSLSLALACSLTVSLVTAQRSTAPLEVRLTGVPGDTGRVLVAVYDSEATWLDTARLAFYVERAAVAGEQVVTIPAVPPGRYALAVVHDADNSGDVTTNFLGIPSEAYGFSNGARGVLGPPRFGEAAVDFDGTGEVVVAVKGFGGS